MIESEIIHSELKKFHGSNKVYQCLNPCFLMSEGVQYLVEAAECHWLVDCLPPYIGRFGDQRVCVELKKLDGKWQLDFMDLAENVWVSEPIDFCTFPLTSIRLFVQASEILGNKWLVSLPSEN